MKHISSAIVALSLLVVNLANAQDEDTSSPNSIKQLDNKYIIECGDLSVCGVSANTVCTEGYDVDYITGSDSKYKMVVKCKKEIVPAPATVTVPVTVTVPNQEPITEPEPELELEPDPEPEEPSNGLGLRIAGSILLADSAVGFLSAPVMCDELSYDEYGHFDYDYYNSYIGVAATVVVVEAFVGVVFLSSGIIKKAVVKRKTNKRLSVNGPSLLVRF